MPYNLALAALVLAGVSAQTTYDFSTYSWYSDVPASYQCLLSKMPDFDQADLISNPSHFLSVLTQEPATYYAHLVGMTTGCAYGQFDSATAAPTPSAAPAPSSSPAAASSTTPAASSSSAAASSSSAVVVPSSSPAASSAPTPAPSSPAGPTTYDFATYSWYSDVPVSYRCLLSKMPDFDQADLISNPSHFLSILTQEPATYYAHLVGMTTGCAFATPSPSDSGSSLPAPSHYTNATQTPVEPLSTGTTLPVSQLPSFTSNSSSVAASSVAVSSGVVAPSSGVVAPSSAANSTAAASTAAGSSTAAAPGSSVPAVSSAPVSSAPATSGAAPVSSAAAPVSSGRPRPTPPFNPGQIASIIEADLEAIISFLSAIESILENNLFRRADPVTGTVDFQSAVAGLSSAASVLDGDLDSAAGSDIHANIAGFNNAAATLATVLDTLADRAGQYTGDSATTLQGDINELSPFLAEIASKILAADSDCADLSALAADESSLVAAFSRAASAYTASDVDVPAFTCAAAASSGAAAASSSAAAAPSAASTGAAGAGDVTITTVVTAYTTYCPEATELVEGGKTYTVTGATTLTVTDCPCTRTSVIPAGSAAPAPAPAPAKPSQAAPAAGNPSQAAPAPAGGNGNGAAPSAAGPAPAPAAGKPSQAAPAAAGNPSAPAQANGAAFAAPAVAALAALAAPFLL